MATKFSLSFVFPMYNEIDNIEQTVAGADLVGRRLGCEYEIIVVNDASTDGCGALAESLRLKYSQLRVFHNEKNLKLGGTLRHGFSKATGDYILYMDSDLPLDFEDVYRAVQQIDDYDMLVGYRLTRDEPLRRKFISRCYNYLIRLLFGLNVRDVNFAFKLFKRDILQQVTLSSDGSFIDAELLIGAHLAKRSIKEIGLVYYARTAGESTLASSSVILKVFREMLSFYKLSRLSHQ